MSVSVSVSVRGFECIKPSHTLRVSMPPPLPPARLVNKTLQLRWNLSASEIEAVTRDCVRAYEYALDGIARLSIPETSHVAVLGAWSAAEGVLATQSAELTLPAYCASSDPGVRRASAASKLALATAFKGATARPDLYAVFSRLRQDNSLASEPGGNHHQFNSSSSSSSEATLSSTVAPADTTTATSTGAAGTAVAAAASPADDKSVTAEDRRLVERLLRDFERAGAALPGAKREELQALRARETKLCGEIEQAINEDTATVLASEDELEGVPQDYIDVRLGRQGKTPSLAVKNGGSSSRGASDVSVAVEKSSIPSGHISIGMKHPDSSPVLLYCTNEDTRRRVEEARVSRCPENVVRLAELVRVRHTAAQLLGYSCHAEFILTPKMAGSESAARQFVEDMIARLASKAEKERAQLQSFSGGDVAAATTSWSHAYHARRHKQELHGVDEEAVSEYFPMDTVLEGIFDLYAQLLSISIVRVDDTCWHEDVVMYEVRDAQPEAVTEKEPSSRTSSCGSTIGTSHSSGSDATATTTPTPTTTTTTTTATTTTSSTSATSYGGGRVLGHFFLDLYPREGKFGHQCVLPIRPGYTLPDGSYQTPAAALIGNNPRPTQTRPSLLRHRQVVTLCHEMGHVLHAVMSRAQHPRFAWAWSAVPWPAGVEYDFLETPSMMGENFAWEPDVLTHRLSGHYTGTPGEPRVKLPDKLAQQIVAGRSYGQAWGYLRYFALALVDLKLHSRDFVVATGGLDNTGTNQSSSCSPAAAAVNALHAETMREAGLLEPPAGTCSVGSWYHMVQGYDAGYYGYGWSEVHAADLWSCFKAAPGGFLDLDLGRRYRETILEKGATRDGADMLRDFLGREPSTQAFLTALGVE